MGLLQNLATISAGRDQNRALITAAQKQLDQNRRKLTPAQIAYYEQQIKEAKSRL